MNVIDYLLKPLDFASPPIGAVNVLRGDTIEGPGGRWVPCATKLGDGVYCAGLFRVGSGQKQVCVMSHAVRSPHEALAQAKDFAACAAA